MLIDVNGNVGIGTTSPQSKLHVYGGEVQVGSSGTSCANNNQGAIRYAGGTLYYCDNASTWESVDSNGAGSDYVEVTSAAPNPTGTSQGYFGASGTQGGIVSGDGTTADVILANKSGTAALEVMTGSTNIYMPGNVGIGTTAPAAALDVRGSSDTIYGYRASADIYGPDLRFRKTRGTVSSPATVQNGDNLGALVWDGYDGTNYNGGTNIQGIVNGSVSLGNVPIDVTFTTSTLERMRITSGGSVGIGTTSPGSTLQVNGGAAVGYSTSTAAPTNGLAVSGSVGVGTTSPAAGMAADLPGR